MPKGVRSEMSPAKKLAKAAELLGLTVVQLHVLLSCGVEDIAQDADLQREMGTRFVESVANWKFLETVGK